MSTEKPWCAPCASRKSGEPRRVLAEMEVEADRGARDRQPVDQDVGDELLGGQPGERRVEGQHDRTVETGCGEEPQLGGLGRSGGMSGASGWKKLRGCGSKVSAAAGRWMARARSSAASITARWPRCTPSKLPMATTGPAAGRCPARGPARRRKAGSERGSAMAGQYGVERLPGQGWLTDLNAVDAVTGSHRHNRLRVLQSAFVRFASLKGPGQSPGAFIRPWRASAATSPLPAPMEENDGCRSVHAGPRG